MNENKKKDYIKLMKQQLANMYPCVALLRDEVEPLVNIIFDNWLMIGILAGFSDEEIEDIIMEL